MGYSTKDIVKKIVNYIKKETPDLLQYNSSKQTIESIIKFFENTGFTDEYIK